MSNQKLALIKNELRNAMTDKRLSALCLLSIESEVMKKLSFEDVIAKFVAGKLRKRLF